MPISPLAFFFILSYKGPNIYVVHTDMEWGVIVAMPSINFKKLGKYLDLQTDRTEKVELPRSSRKLYLERIKNSCLNVFQQIRVIKEVISSKILFQLRLLDQEARLGS